MNQEQKQVAKRSPINDHPLSRVHNRQPQSHCQTDENGGIRDENPLSVNTHQHIEQPATMEDINGVMSVSENKFEIASVIEPGQVLVESDQPLVKDISHDTVTCKLPNCICVDAPNSDLPVLQAHVEPMTQRPNLSTFSHNEQVLKTEELKTTLLFDECFQDPMLHDNFDHSGAEITIDANEDPHDPTAIMQSTGVEDIVVAHEMATLEVTKCLNNDIYRGTAISCIDNQTLRPTNEPTHSGHLAETIQSSTANLSEASTFVPNRSMISAEKPAQREIMFNSTNITAYPRLTQLVSTSIALPAVEPVLANATSDKYNKVTACLRMAGDNTRDHHTPPPSYYDCIDAASLMDFKLLKKLPAATTATTHHPNPEIPPDRCSVPILKPLSKYEPLENSGYCSLQNSRSRILDVDDERIPHTSTEYSRQHDIGRTGIMDNDHQLLSFIACLFCWPIGLVAIYYSNMSQMLRAQGDYTQAQVYARQAFIISSLGLCSGSLTYIIVFICEKIM